jgi:hypothetical protein
MIGRSIAAAFVLLTASSTGRAEDCLQYPQGPARFECANRNHPGRLAKQERCREQGRQMGLQPRGGSGGAGGGLKEFVVACMQRN